MNLSKLIRLEKETKESPEKVIANFIKSIEPKDPHSPQKEQPPSAQEEGGSPSPKRRRLEESPNRSAEENERTQHDVTVRNLPLGNTIKRKIENHPSHYQVKLYVITSTNDSQMSKAVNSIVEGDQKMETSNTTKSFMFFFYRNGDPDIFVMTSGQAFRKVQNRSCPYFTKKIAKRLLEFKTIAIETRNLTGRKEQTRKIFPPNSPNTPNILHLIHVIVHSYRASRRPASSLDDLPAFQELGTTFTIKPFFMKAHQPMFITDMLLFIEHTAKIDRGEETFFFECRQIEDKNRISELNQRLPVYLILKGDVDQIKSGDETPTLASEGLNLPVIYEHVHYHLKGRSWYEGDEQIADEKLIENLYSEFSPPCITQQYVCGENEINLVQSEEDQTAETEYNLFEINQDKPFMTCKTLPTLCDILITLHKQKRIAPILFTWLIEKVQLKIGEGKKTPIVNYIKQNKIHFTFGGDSYIYIWATFHRKPETDDGQFQCFELIQEERDQQVIGELEKEFDESLKTDSELSIPLSLPDLSEWLHADTFKLYLGTKKKPEGVWPRMPATLKEVLDSICKLQTSSTLDWLRNTAKFTVQFEGEGPQKRKPMTDLLVHQRTLKNKLYIFWHGKWLKIKSEFVSIVADTFVNYINRHTLTGSICCPLPWVHKGKDEETKKSTAKKNPGNGKSSEKSIELIKSRSFQMEELTKFMKLSFPDLNDKTCSDLLRKISCDDTPDNSKGIRYKKHLYEEEDKVIVMLNFLRGHSNLVELLYNTSYILYDRYRYNNQQEEGYIVGDQILTRNNIEMFDILKFDQKKTYLIHVKYEFGKTVRDVCSQIKNSAKLLFHSLTNHSSMSMLEEMWRTYTSEPDEQGAQYQYRKATKNRVTKLTKSRFFSLFDTDMERKKEIVYLLAVRDERKENYFKEKKQMTKDLEEHYGNKMATDILGELRKQEYVTDQFFGKYMLTDKFRLQRKGEFIKTMEAASQGDLKSVWDDVFKLLKNHLPSTESTIAQLEIVELFDNFSFCYGSKMTLKLIFLPTSFEDLEQAFRPAEM